MKSNFITKGLYGRIYKEQPFLYIDGVLVDSNYQIIETNISLTRAAKLIRNSNNPINGRTFFKKIKLDDLEDEAIQKLTEMGLLEQ